MFEETKENRTTILSGGIRLALLRLQRILVSPRGLTARVVVLIVLIILLTVFTLSITAKYEEDKSSEKTKHIINADEDSNSRWMQKQIELEQKEREISSKLAELIRKEEELRAKEVSLSQEANLLEEKRKQLEEIQQVKQQIEQQQQELQKMKSVMDKERQRGDADADKRAAVKQAFMHAWNGYKRVWGQDELAPVDGSAHNWMGLGLTIVDSLDTLWIMDLKDEFHEARNWVADNLRFDLPKSVSFFETTIRVLGGLLSAYELSGDKMFLSKADDLGTRFLPAFNTRTGLPRTTINLKTGESNNPSWTAGAGVLSEMATVQLEFTYLAHHTGKSVYREKALKVFDHLDSISKHNGLYSIYVNTETGQFTKRHITLGAMGDSFYEYLIKIWLLTNKSLPKYRKMYDDAVDNIKTHLIKRSKPSNLLYIAELIDGNIVDKMDHLVCFAGAMFAVGAEDSPRSDDMELAKGLTATCHEMYKRTATGIGSEIVQFTAGQDFVVPPNARHYLLRPEAVESFFVLWRTTHDPIYREMGWQAFQAIDKYCKTTYGYSGIRDVTSVSPSFDNLQQSFFLAETLKYLYLLFSEDELIPLDKYVFNTEAHPLGKIN